VRGGYAIPDTIVRIERELDTLRRDALMCLIGSQGVGKSSALMALSQRIPKAILLKWRGEQDLHNSFLQSSRKTFHAYVLRYSVKLDRELASKLPGLGSWDRRLFDQFGKDIGRFEAEGVLYSSFPDLAWAESMIDDSTVRRLRKDTCLEVLFDNQVILIDTPDYSKTDRRRMAKDLESIYWLWNRIASSGGPSMVFAVQKEMSEGHFFLDKAQRFELEPLQADRMVGIYARIFDGVKPFTEEGLFKLALMSRGIFRRFLRYILLSLDLWERGPSMSEAIDVDLVTRAVPVERLAADMELELTALFPKNSDLRWLAVRLIMLLEAQGERKQGELADLLGAKDYTMTRLLETLEAAHYINRRRDGNEKIVSLHSQPAAPDMTPTY
jgi:hypothetical protein